MKKTYHKCRKCNHVMGKVANWYIDKYEKKHRTGVWFCMWCSEVDFGA